MPDAEPYRAWATFQFTGPSGRVNECDLLVAVPGGLYLLELKGHPGRVANHGDTWQFHDERVRTLEPPAPDRSQGQGAQEPAGAGGAQHGVGSAPGPVHQAGRGRRVQGISRGRRNRLEPRKQGSASPFVGTPVPTCQHGKSEQKHLSDCIFASQRGAYEWSLGESNP
ncbi:NERD domain-containing protein [Streptomyces tirandamycinicus]|uniref:NERD domain-containing protein n=1 Tax=Streptomyces tirandamycinicus TaxID=2174846 RepID=UPI00226DC6D9|nr:NERD domain-containing protein [Streptomyces tirandamycinicus]MCY0982350.1 NERD domain-containing protein [Streptomyces tirandamycinicus]